jgi:hypothetical protein
LVITLSVFGNLLRNCVFGQVIQIKFFQDLTGAKILIEKLKEILLEFHIGLKLAFNLIHDVLLMNPLNFRPSALEIANNGRNQQHYIPLKDMMLKIVTI